MLWVALLLETNQSKRINLPAGFELSLKKSQAKRSTWRQRPSRRYVHLFLNRSTVWTLKRRHAVSSFTSWPFAHWKLSKDAAVWNAVAAAVRRFPAQICAVLIQFVRQIVRSEYDVDRARRTQHRVRLQQRRGGRRGRLKPVTPFTCNWHAR